VEYGVTHVVAAKDGTDKAIASRKVPGCVLVKPGWLMESFWSMTNRDVEPFLMGRGIGDVTKSTRSNINKNVLRESHIENCSEASSNDSEDDDFAAELEEAMTSDIIMVGSTKQEP
jgi:hypothetical protein